MIRPEIIDVSPDVNILSRLRYTNYSPWFAVAEFVDNSIQSFLDYQNEIEKCDGPNAKLKVDIELGTTNGENLIVRDNAAGIHEADYERAFRSAAKPINTSGLSEFGIGMKSAASWFSPTWMVRTTALGESMERTVSFDIDKIVENNSGLLTVGLKPIKPNIHFTEITLFNPDKRPQGNTIKKIKEHLASIYRMFIREGLLQLRFRGEALSYEEPEILYAPFHKNQSEGPRLWKKEIDFNIGTDLHVHGFAALREKMSSSQSGFAMFRKNRLIQGSTDEGYRPKFIFGPQNHWLYRRLFGELHLEGFNVSHTKDRVQWDENEELFLDLLKKELEAAPTPLLSQGRGYRAKSQTWNLKKGAEVSTQRTAKTIKEEVPPIIERQLIEGPEDTPPLSNLPSTKELIANRTVSVEIDHQTWEISIELSNDPTIEDWLSISDESFDGSIKRVRIQMALAHEFMRQYGGAKVSQIEPLLRVAIAIALAEITARDMGIKMAGTFKSIINDLLRDALWKPNF